MPISGLLLLAAAAAAAPDAVRRWRALAGVALVALALASLEVAGGADWRQVSLPPAYLAYNAGVTLLGLWVLLASLVWGARAPGGPRQLVVWAGVVLTLGVGAAMGRALFLAAGVGVAVLHALGLGVAAVLALALGRAARLARILTWTDRWLDPAVSDGETAPRWDRLLLLQGGAVVVAMLAPNLVAVLLALLLSIGLEAAQFRRRTPSHPLPLRSLLALVVLLALSGLVFRVVGDAGFRVSAVAEAPFSEAFEVLAALLAGLTAWLTLGLWPWHRRPGFLGPLVAAVLLQRLGAPGIPGGLSHWQALFYGGVTLGAVYAAAARREDTMLCCLGALGLLSGDPSGGWAGLTLVALGSILGAGSPRLAVVGSAGQALFLAAALIAVGAGVAALRAGLGAETVFSVATLGAAAVLLVRASPRPSR